MTGEIYAELQDGFYRKLIPYPGRREEEYNRGIKACKSILHSVYNRISKENEEDFRCPPAPFPESEYEELKGRFEKKLFPEKRTCFNRKEHEYNSGVQACGSVMREVFENEN